VQFAKQLQDQGKGRHEATVEAWRLRLRPILMTSSAFILGVVPLVLARGAGAEMRVAFGVAVLSGMLGVTVFAIFFTPVFYVCILGFLSGQWRRRPLGGLTPPLPTWAPSPGTANTPRRMRRSKGPNTISDDVSCLRARRASKGLS
jgi:multidrug efflux pump